MTLGQIIKNFRSHHDLTMREFAQKCGVSHSYIAMLEDGKNSKTGSPITPTLVTLKKISIGLGITIDELIAKASDMPVKIYEENKEDLPEDIIIYHRDGKTVKKQFTKEQMDMLLAMINAIPEKPKDI